MTTRNAILLLSLACGILLHTAAKPMNLWEAVWQEKVPLVSQLLASGADVNERFGADQETVLHAAASAANLELTALLLRSGADVNARNGEKRTPLVDASLNGNDKMVALLLENGADQSIPCEATWCVQTGQRSPLEAAATRGHAAVVELLGSQSPRVDDVQLPTPLDAAWPKNASEMQVNGDVGQHDRSKRSAKSSRTFTFKNQCPYPVWLGLSGGSTESRSRSRGTRCQSNQDCHVGSSCVQTGGIKQCFWNNPVPRGGNYRLAEHGGSNVVSVPVYDNGLGHLWSGAITGRTNCGPGRACEVADCGGNDGACKPSQGFSQPATQAEITMQRSTADYYDVEVINGISIPVEMVPNNAPPGDARAPYRCGSAGGTVPVTRLGKCTWQFSPPSNDYRWVKGGGKSCTADRDCSRGSVCGLSDNPGHAKRFLKTCGKPLGYWSANQVCQIDPNYGAPFYCSERMASPQSHLRRTNLYACTAVGSCYSNNARDDCCGCVDWEKEGFTVPSSPLTDKCQNQNRNWVDKVKPTLSWMKRGCPTAYVYPYDDKSSTFTCQKMVSGVNSVNYSITFCPK